MDWVNDQAEASPARPTDKSVAEAILVPVESECPGSSGLCGVPLAAGAALCPSCGGTPVEPGGSANLQRQIQPPATPECARCRRPVPQAGGTCPWCLGQGPATVSPKLQAVIDTRTVAECPGEGGLCAAPLAPGERRCVRCRDERSAARPQAAFERCRGRGGACGQMVLPGRGQCLECRQTAGVSRITTFRADGVPD